jgi:uroporphyrinogen decarboxylase
MPRGTPDDVRRAVRETIGAMHSLEGGHVLGSVHNVQDDVPPENVWALLDEAQKFGGRELLPQFPATRS